MTNISSDEPLTRENLLRHIRQGWQDLQAYLSTLTVEQLTLPMDLAGWTAKDHIIHLAVWEDGIRALLEGGSRREAMGVDELTWKSDVDQINALIQQNHRHLSLERVLETLDHVHSRLMSVLDAMTDEALLLPYNHYAPESDSDSPVFWRVAGNTFLHYEEHLPWIKAIVEAG